VKVSPSNQTLILAGEREGPRTTQGANGATTGSVSSSGARASVTRVTVYSARVDEIVQFTIGAATEQPGASSNAQVPIAMPARSVAPPPSRNSPASGLTANQGASQYSVTQRMLTEPEVGRSIDVFA
jgi:hypothetical protein